MSSLNGFEWVYDPVSKELRIVRVASSGDTVIESQCAIELYRQSNGELLAEIVPVKPTFKPIFLRVANVCYGEKTTGYRVTGLSVFFNESQVELNIAQLTRLTLPLLKKKVLSGWKLVMVLVALTLPLFFVTIQSFPLMVAIIIGIILSGFTSLIIDGVTTYVVLSPDQKPLHQK